MSNRIVLPIAVFLALSCSPDSSGDDRAIGLLEKENVHETRAILVRRDELRARTWLLRADALYLYEDEPGTRARRFALPGWIYVTPRLAREPDLLVEAGGTVLVSSNIVPALWRVDPEASSTTELELELHPETSRDFGFTTLRFAQNGALHASGSIDRSRWQVDLLNRRAIRLGGASN